MNGRQSEGSDDGENVDPNIVPVDKDSPMKVREGKKCNRNSFSFTVSIGLDFGETNGERIGVHMTDFLAGSIGQSSWAL